MSSFGEGDQLGARRSVARQDGSPVKTTGRDPSIERLLEVGSTTKLTHSLTDVRGFYGRQHTQEGNSHQTYRTLLDDSKLCKRQRTSSDKGAVTPSKLQKISTASPMATRRHAPLDNLPTSGVIPKSRPFVAQGVSGIAYNDRKQVRNLTNPYLQWTVPECRTFYDSTYHGVAACRTNARGAKDTTSRSTPTNRRRASAPFLGLFKALVRVWDFLGLVSVVPGSSFTLVSPFRKKKAISVK